jgi:hypothetical protein
MAAATTISPLPEPTDRDLLDLVTIHTQIKQQPAGGGIWVPSMPKFENPALNRRVRRISVHHVVFRLYQAHIDAWWATRDEAQGYEKINARIQERNEQIMAAAMWAARARVGETIIPFPTEEAARRVVHSNSIYGTVLRRTTPGGPWIDVISIPLEEITATSRIRSAADELTRA